MNVETSKKVLKISGILTIVLGVFLLLLGILAMVAGGSLVGNTNADLTADVTNDVAVAIGGGFVLIISAILTLIEGIISYQAGKTGKKKLATISLVLAVLSTISSIYNLLSGASNSTASNIVSTVVGIAINVLVCYASYVVRQAAVD